jgi:nitrite reductase/ring-hydroxylating ferredoxin subunit
MTWTDAFPAERLPAGSARAFRSDHGRIAVFHTDDGALYATDDVCPHEGYPLVQGDVSGCTLTCCWHNYKFDLRTGGCLVGEEGVRTHPVRVQDGRVQVDVRPPDPESLRRAWLASLHEATHEEQLGRAARDVARLLSIGHDPADLLAWSTAFDARYARWGPTHVLPLSADLLTYLGGHDATLVVMQSIELAARHVRRPVRPRPEPTDPGDDPVAAGARLRTLVEAEDAEGAEALVRGALARGWGRAEIAPWLLTLCADHFLDFGHALIYASKLWDLLSDDTPERTDLIVGAFVFGIVLGTREDVLPPWAGWRRRMADVDVTARYRAARSAPASPALRERLLPALTDTRAPAAFAATLRALDDGLSFDDLVHTLVAAASIRMLRLDPTHEGNPELAHGWLDVTHQLTFTHALREMAEAHDHPDLMRLALQAVQFVAMHRPLDGPVPEAEAGDLRAALSTGDAEAAVASARALPAKDTLALLRTLPLEDVAVGPIYTAHLFKTAVAAEAEHAALPAAWRDLPVLATVRFFGSPLDQRRMRRRVHEAKQLVEHGRVPKTLV